MASCPKCGNNKLIRGKPKRCKRCGPMPSKPKELPRAPSN